MKLLILLGAAYAVSKVATSSQNSTGKSVDLQQIPTLQTRSTAGDEQNGTL